MVKETTLGVLKKIESNTSVIKDILTKGTSLPAIDKSGFLGLMHSPKRFEKLSDGWLRDQFISSLYGKKFDWAPDSLEKHLQWKAAEEYAAQFGRQPSDFELQTLIDRSKYNPAIVEGAKVLNLKTDDWYQSGVSHASFASYVWCVYFHDGDVSYIDKGYAVYVRPVRLSQ